MDKLHGGVSSRGRVGIVPILLALVAGLLLAFAPDARAQEPAGRLISGVGAVTAVDEEGGERSLGRGDDVYAGETLVLGDRASAQIRMRDDALVELEASSRFAVERYGADGGGSSSVIMRLFRGAMRTITGTIGDRPEHTYRLHTPVATIGVRGTQYALHLCDAECAGEDRDAGLYGRVDEGAVSVANDAASGVFRKNDYFYVAGLGVPPREIVRPPEGILDGGAVSSGALFPSDDALAEAGVQDDALLDSDLDGTVEGTTGALAGTIEGTTDALASTVEGTTEFLGGTVEGTTAVLGGTVADLGGAVGGTIGGDLGDTVTGAGETLDDAITGVGDAGGDLITGAGEIGSETLEDPVETVTNPDETVEDVVEVTEELVSDTEQVVDDTVDGLLGGGDDGSGDDDGGLLGLF